MFLILGWLLFGFIVGSIVKWLHPGEEPIGFLPTVGIGIVGSFIGGMIHHVLIGGHYHHSGLIFSVVGGVVFCYLYSWYKSRV